MKPIAPLGLASVPLLVTAAVVVLTAPGVVERYGAQSSSPSRLEIAKPSPVTTAQMVQPPNAAVPSARVKASIRKHRVADPAPKPASIEAAPPGTAGLMVVIDPSTGAPTQPTDQQIRELSRGIDPGLNWSMEGLEVVILPDGSTMVDMKGRFANYSVARLDAAGKAHVTCVHGHSLADHLRHACGAAPAVSPGSAATWEEK